MTAQMKDKFIFHRGEYSVSAIEFPENFINIYSLGFNPKELHTACYRGYIAAFSIYRNKLALKNLHTNNGNDIENKPPLINNKSAEIGNTNNYIEEYKNSYREFTYKNINLIIPYTGSILITKDFIRERYIHMGFQSPLSYTVVIQLTFDNGNLTLAKDFSDIAKSVREKKLKIDKKYDNIFNWIDDCFDISYSSKAKVLIDNMQLKQDTQRKRPVNKRKKE